MNEIHLRITGPLDHSVLAEVLDDLIGAAGDGRLVDIEMMDLSASDRPEDAAREEVIARTGTASGPLLLRLGTDDHVVSFPVDALDGRRVSDLVTSYRARIADHPSEAAGLIDPDRLAADLAWWQQRLAGLPPDLELPVDRAPRDTGRPLPVHVELGADLTRRIETFAGESEVAEGVVVVGAFQTVLARLTGQDDVTIGLPSVGWAADRAGPDPLVLRSVVDLAAGFDRRCRSTGQEMSEALEHGRVPVSRLQAVVRPPDAEEHAPLYRVSLSFVDVASGDGGVSFEPWVVPAADGTHLAVTVERRPESIGLEFAYDSGRFCRATVERWAGALERLLTAALDDPATHLARIPLISDTERALVEGGWDGPPSTGEAPPLPADLLAEAARLRPDAIALQATGESLTYAEFDSRVDRFAASLQARGYGPGDAAVLFLGRGVDTAVAIFGALRAGVAYVPVDADLTAEWLRTVCSQVDPVVVVTRSALRDEAAGTGIAVATVDELVTEGRGTPARRPGSSDLAYVLFTSGSTGPPKGVLIEQGNLAAWLAGAAEEQPYRPGDRVTWFHSVSFDALASNLHAVVTSGATSVIRDDDVISSVPRFLGWCREQEITHIRVPSSFAQILMEEIIEGRAEVPPTARVLAFGGEQMRADVVEAWRRARPGRLRLWNNYGPTEATVWQLWAEVGVGPHPMEWVPIGRPMRSVRIRIRDIHEQVVPIGVAGELWIGGPLVARGYLGSPELTSSRFRTDQDGTRWYRTGDLARWLPDGQVEVLGRIDRQVKVRGYRVEPAEVEMVLREMPGVRDAVVIPRPGADGELSLHAYVETDSPIEGIRRALFEALPPFLRPSTTTAIGAVPRTISGKVDAARLPEPGTTAPAIPAPVERDTTRAVADIWAEVLKVDVVGPEDGFFELGGHSLLAIRVLSRIREQLGVDVPLTALFQHPTAAGLAIVIDEMVGQTAAPSQPADVSGTASDSGVDLARLLDEIESLSDEEAAALLARLEAESGP